MDTNTFSFKEFADEFRQENAEILQLWQRSSDPLRRAIAQIIQEANKGF